MKAALRAVWPDMGAGDTDLHKAFAWCNLTIARDGGHVGVVLPRTAVSDVGMQSWRKRILTGGIPHRRIAVATLINYKGWVFPGVHNSYTVALVAFLSSRSSHASTPSNGVAKGLTGATQSASSQPPDHSEQNPGGTFDDAPVAAIYPGPASSEEALREIIRNGPELIPVSELEQWSSSWAIPQVPTREAFRVWRKIKRHPLFGADLRDEKTPPLRIWRFRPVTELHSTNDRPLFLNDDGRAAGGIT